MTGDEITVSRLFDQAVQSHRSNKPDLAERQYRQILARVPAHIGALQMLGLLLAGMGRISEAIGLLEQAIQIRPTEANLHYNLAKVLKQAGRAETCIEEYRRAIALRPQFPEALNNLGNALHNAGQDSEALQFYNQALTLRPNYPEAHFNCGRVLYALERTDDAIAAFRRAIALRPHYVEAHNNLGLALLSRERLDEAVAAFRQALLLRPGSIDALGNLGNALKDLGELDEAIACFRQAAAGNPDPRPAENVLMLLPYHPAYDNRRIYEEHAEWSRRYAQPLASSIVPHSNEPDPDRRLRVGYVSPHLNETVVGRYFIPLLEHHDHRGFEIFCYNDSRRDDAVSRRLRSISDEWRNTADLTEEQVAGQIRADRIDLLVDLALHMNHNRLLVFARKPAPVQLTWLGYPGTTGLSTIDYRLSDPYLDPPDENNESFYSEKTIRLPHSFWCYPSPGETTGIEPPPAIRNGFITFGCFSTFCKVTAPTVEAWAAVLRAVPRSRLLALAPPGAARERLVRMLADRDVEPSRIEAVGRQPFQQYLQLYNRIDVGLDTFPCNGHTTSLDSLWMGVPFVTLRGQTLFSRAGTSILSNLGLPELIASNPGQFAEIATTLAKDLPRLEELRSTLRQRIQTSSLMDARQFARDMEAVYRRVWKDWCATAPTRHQ